MDMAERTMMVTLNGEVLFNDRGSELAAKDFDIRDGERVFDFIVLLYTYPFHQKVQYLNTSMQLKLYLSFPIFPRPVAGRQCWGEPGGEAKPGPPSWLSAVLYCLWPAGGISTICCQHGQRPRPVDELETASVYLNNA